MNYRSIIFDLDGTLLDTLPDIVVAVNEVLENMGVPTHPQESIREFIGSGVTVLFERAIPKTMCEPPIVQQCVSQFFKTYSQHWNRHTKQFAHIPELLDRLREADCKLAVLSNKPDTFTKQCVAEYFSPHLLCPVFGQRDGIACKPDPQALHEIMEYSRIPSGQTMFVGDTVIDIQTAKNAGICSVGVGWGYRPREELLLAGPDHFIERPLDLLPLVADI
ncbi:MAG TPA: HAD family hydrolase [Pirellulales bacterium]|jgi:phosphoglycolate phosphatase|nr:HAD family hydrolase [Pirellulales bacterium]|tara:strand:- start:95 stop:754 length:660 start_codon:yes stop_codon:yes gene_type:complete